jgi:hypothetical protein
VSRVRADSSALRVSLRAFAADLGVNAERAVDTAARVAEGAAKQTTDWKDGEETWPDGTPRRYGVHTRDTIEGGSLGLRGWVEAGGAARFLEASTRPHEIHARRRAFLRFFVNGVGPIYRKSVNHPGTRATLFLRTAATEGAIFLSRRLRGVVSEAKRRYGLR